MCIFDKCEIEYTPIKIEHLGDKPDNMSAGYKTQNPAGHIPMISEGSFKLMGGDLQTFLYIINSKPEIKQKLFPEGVKEAKIKSMLGWYSAKMKSPGYQLLKIVYQPKTFQSNPTIVQYEKSKKEFERLFTAINEKLVKGENGTSFNYLTGDTFTIADVVIYSEIQQFMAIC